MIYNTGSKDDWDYYSKVVEDPEWSWDAMKPYRDLNQRYVKPNDHHDDVSQKQTFSLLHSYHSFSQTHQYSPDAHSRDGVVSISLPGYTWPIDSIVNAATTEPAMASDFAFQRDMNTGDMVRIIMVVMLSRQFFNWLPFRGTDRLWLDSGQRRQRSAQQFCHLLPWAEVHRSPEPARPG